MCNPGAVHALQPQWTPALRWRAQTAAVVFASLVEQQRLRTLSWRGFGADFIKQRLRCSPDALAQMALQLVRRVTARSSFVLFPIGLAGNLLCYFCFPPCTYLLFSLALFSIVFSFLFTHPGCSYPSSRGEFWWGGWLGVL
jgi:hypothetical protein